MNALGDEVLPAISIPTFLRTAAEPHSFRNRSSLFLPRNFAGQTGTQNKDRHAWRLTGLSTETT
jgi:hypothetical protein